LAETLLEKTKLEWEISDGKKIKPLINILMVKFNDEIKKGFYVFPL